MIVSDGEPPRSIDSAVVPGSSSALVWTTGVPTAPLPDPTPSVESLIPRPGGTTAIVVRFPPDSVYADPGFDPESAAAEQLVMSPGLAELFEAEDPAMHTTPTVDYAVVMDGEIVLDLDGDSTVVRQGDVVVQNGTRHAWRNPGPTPVTVFFVLLGNPERSSDLPVRADLAAAPPRGQVAAPRTHRADFGGETNS